jgi:hypothetical protein
MADTEIPTVERDTALVVAVELCALSDAARVVVSTVAAVISCVVVA